MADTQRISVGKYATLALILGAHVLFVLLLSHAGLRSVRLPSIEEPRSLLYFFEPPPEEPEHSESTVRAPSLAPPPVAPSDESSAITLPSEALPTDADVDWYAERDRVAREWGKREADRKRRSMGEHPDGMPLPPRSPYPKRGDVQQWEGGVVIEWINDHCYLTNQPPPGAMIGDKYGPQKICKPGGGRSKYKDFDEWKRDVDAPREEGEDLP